MSRPHRASHRHDVSPRSSGRIWATIFAAIFGWTLGSAGGVGPAWGQPSSPAGKFTDVTEASGLGAFCSDLPQNYWETGLHLVDLDGDGNLDFFLSCHAGGAGQALLGDGKGHFTPATGAMPTTEIHLMYDIDEDGKPDLNVTRGDGGAEWWLNCSELGKLHFVRGAEARPDNQGRDNLMVDINGDGKVDWLHGGKSTQAPGKDVFLDLGDGSGQFTRGQTLAVEGLTDRSDEIAVMAADFCGNGRMDLAVQWGLFVEKNGKSRLYRNETQLEFTDVTAKSGLQVDNFAIKGIGDFNQDGAVDLLVLENLNLEIYLNDGKGHFTKKVGALQGVAGPEAKLASWGLGVVVDFNNDGKPDIIVNGKFFLKIFRGNGDGTFTYVNGEWGIEDYSKSDAGNGICFGDVDNDGRLDIIGYHDVPGTPRARRPIVLYHNDLPALNWVRVRPVGGAGNRGATGAKIRLYEPGGLGDPAKLIGFEQICIYGRQSAQSYYGLGKTERHFGLGTRKNADLSVEFYPSHTKVDARHIDANQIVTVEEKFSKTSAEELGQ